MIGKDGVGRERVQENWEGGREGVVMALDGTELEGNA